MKSIKIIYIETVNPINLIGNIYIGLMTLMKVISMTTITVSNEVRVRLVRLKDENLRSLDKVLDQILKERGEGGIDYSNCPDCKMWKLQTEAYKKQNAVLKQQIELMPQEEQTAQDRINEIKKDGHKDTVEDLEDNGEDQ